ncbi:Hpt domain-containing protein [Pseudomonas sp.]|uniref:Hpt domain-containing protein n=1 Tax=Pseudomonas sp. TaxID=306 RepID=UPI00262BD8DF|nr:Hpt domain-containing protein [Pseudomonas sp.]
MEGEYPTLIDTFLSDSEQLLEQLHHALLTEASSLDELTMAAHSFKGSSGNMGAVRLSELCGQLEERTQRRELSGAEGWVHDIEREFAEVRHLFSIERQRFN